MEKHDAHVLAQQEQNDSYVGWYDATIGAGNWFAMSDVSPVDAAMLLCQFNPNTDNPERAEQFENEDISPGHLKQLRRRFEDLQKTEPRHRSLVDWLEFANEAGLKHHSWPRRYQEALRAGLGDTTSATAVLLAPVSASGGVVAPKQRAQENRIVELLREKGHDPLKLPSRIPGKPGHKAEIKMMALLEPALFTQKTFDTAWQRLRDAGDISDGE